MTKCVKTNAIETTVRMPRRKKPRTRATYVVIHRENVTKVDPAQRTYTQAGRASNVRQGCLTLL
eukprot:CAMPEP_0198229834 /NCGR_PEP_ID=MMETSP1445-20131203/114325_1 /TAXON_ID=36898 /ORGANISM="Pyramimonas sp., Strain CCMP2087" /LENGTH=63 /DNA_ID=CAMNT_0043910317 /DNA_START=1345 /DNA_END=1536 /DNA_ORIENTATION=+